MGDVSGISILGAETLDLNAEFASESPRAGRSTRCVELYEDPDVAGESSGVGDDVREVSS